jgi:hypothetical protein
MLYKSQEDLKTRVSETTRQILIKELPESIDKEYLVLYFEVFEETNDMMVENVEISTDKSSAIVEFHDQAGNENVSGVWIEEEVDPPLRYINMIFET